MFKFKFHGCYSLHSGAWAFFAEKYGLAESK